MVVIVRGSVPAVEFALHHTLSSLSDIEIEIERIVKSGEKAVIPLLWIREVERESFEAVLDDDPTVKEFTQLAEFENELLYQMEWIDQVRLLLQMLTNSKATILNAVGHRDRWYLRIMYPNRDLLSSTHDFCERQGLTFDIESIRDMDGEPASRYGLTSGQYEALLTAFDRGYYSIPREITLEGLAEELGMSHQALSELLRRGVGGLIEDALVIGEIHDEDEGNSAL